MYIIRQATLDDIQALVNYRIELFKDMGKIKIGDNVQDFEVSLKTYYKTNLGSRFMSWVAVDKDTIVAISGLNILQKPPKYNNLSGLEGYIMNIYVDTEYRRQGIGTNLMKEILKYTDKEGIKAITLMATDKGKRLYESLGFRSYHDGMIRLRS